jgi:hypothetical protein
VLFRSLPTLDRDGITCSDNFTPGAGGFATQHLGTSFTGGELSGLFVTDLGNHANGSDLNPVVDTAEQIANLVLFSNVQTDAYWSGTALRSN